MPSTAGTVLYRPAVSHQPPTPTASRAATATATYARRVLNSQRCSIGSRPPPAVVPPRGSRPPKTPCCSPFAVLKGGAPASYRPVAAYSVLPNPAPSCAAPTTIVCEPADTAAAAAAGTAQDPVTDSAGAGTPRSVRTARRNTSASDGRRCGSLLVLSLIHISEPTRLGMIS